MFGEKIPHFYSSMFEKFIFLNEVVIFHGVIPTYARLVVRSVHYGIYIVSLYLTVFADHVTFSLDRERADPTVAVPAGAADGQELPALRRVDGRQLGVQAV